jgi:D-xylose 1-dehydrogenase
MKIAFEVPMEVVEMVEMVEVAIYPDLARQSVLITGGGSGIGADIARAFMAQGSRVAILDYDADLLARMSNSLPGLETALVDVRDIAALRVACQDLAQRCGGFHTLVNNVASDERHHWQDITPEYWDDRININLRPGFFAAQCLAPAMIDLGGGAIINLGSTSWMIKGKNYPVYATCKSAMNGLTRSLAREFGAHRIRVNTVVPGWVMTERQLALWVDAEGERAIEQNQCLPGRLQGSDIAQMVLFLASAASRMITAQEFVVDAGWT